MHLLSRSLLIAVLLGSTLAACGGDEGGAPTTSARGGGDWCALLEGDEPTDALVDAVPGEHREAAQVVVDFSTMLEGIDDDDGPDLDLDAAASAIVGEVERIDAFAEDVQSSCPNAGEEAVQGLRLLTTVAALASEDRKDDYCTQLAASFGESAGGGAEAMSAIAAIAPGSHTVAWESIAALSSSGDSDGDGDGDDGMSDDVATEAIASFMGLGLYAESVCDIDDAFAQMMLAGAFMSMGEGFGETNAGTIGTDPPVADPAAANAAVPAQSAVEFEVRTIDLDEDGERKASVVVPTGWEVDETIGVMIAPPDDSPWGFFTSMDVDAGCDGMCEVTDWEARLRGDDGYLTSLLEEKTVTEDRPTSTGTGVVVTTTDDTGDVRVIVLRWDDSVDHYFRCEAQLDVEDAPLLPAFVAACEASRPNWFAVS